MRKVAIMQPYFFPYLGYISLVKHTELFILLDSVQFIRHGWIERNRTLKQNEGWLYIQVPLIRESRNTVIKDVLINNQLDWKNKILSQIQPYKKVAPYYNDVKELISKVFTAEYSNIVALNKASLEAVCSYLSIDTPIEVFSEMRLDIKTPTAPDEWALNICKSLGDVSEYWNPPGGIDFFDKRKYDEANIKLVFQRIKLTDYNQKRTPFEMGLSIIDVMMFNSPQKINEMLDNYETA